MPRRIGLPIQQWPIEDRQAWARSCAPADYFAVSNTAARWWPKTRQGAEAAYGRWLSFLRDRFPAALAEPPAARPTDSRVKLHAQTLAARITAVSVASELAHLIMAFRAIAPEMHLPRLRQLQCRMQKAAAPRDKRPRMVHPARLLSLAFDLMDNAAYQEGPLQRARAFRDGLMIGLLAARPIRRQALAGIRIGNELQQNDSGYVLAFRGESMKSRKPIEFSMPDYLNPYVDKYLRHFRLLFPRAKASVSMWPSSLGGDLTYDAVYAVVCRRTKATFGFSINPHLFRDIAATALARELPESFTLAKDLLTHANLHMTLQHYTRASTLHAGRRHADTIAKLRAGACGKL